MNTKGSTWVIDLGTMAVASRSEQGGTGKVSASIVPVDGRVLVRAGVHLRAYGRR